MGEASLWMHTSDFQWLYEYVVKLRQRAVNDMIEGVDPEEYAVLRGYIQACDHVLKAPERYLTEMKKPEARSV